MRTTPDAGILWTKYTELHVAIERIILDQGKGYTDVLGPHGVLRSVTSANNRLGSGSSSGPAHNTSTVSIRNRWVGKCGRIRREGMGKRVNYCARSVVTCDSHLSANEIMVPRSVVHRLTVPMVVHSFNRAFLMQLMRQGQVHFNRGFAHHGPTEPMQRANDRGHNMRSISHLAMQNLTLREGDCILRHNLRYRLGKGCTLPPILPEDVPLPVQCLADPAAGILGITLCFQDRVLDTRQHC